MLNNVVPKFLQVLNFAGMVGFVFFRLIIGLLISKMRLLSFIFEIIFDGLVMRTIDVFLYGNKETRPTETIAKFAHKQFIQLDRCFGILVTINHWQEVTTSFPSKTSFGLIFLLLATAIIIA